MNKKGRENDHYIIFTQSKKEMRDLHMLPSINWYTFDIHQGQICNKAVVNGKKQYLENWNLKDKCWIQNMGNTQ